jgi:uncharacterized protein YjbJ (UPF0337 family)
MGSTTDKITGHVKETVGDLTDNKDLESEGKADRQAGEVKEHLDHAKDKVEEVVDKAKDKADEAVDKAKDTLGHK